jgi:uncharacterized protein (DUF58 family)
MSARPSSDTLLTTRGVGMGASGVVLGGLGMGLSSPTLVYIGIALCAAVAVGVLWMVLSISAFLRRFPFASRHVAPRPLSVGAPGIVTVTVRARGARTGGAMRRLVTDRLDIREQAATELTGTGGSTASVTRSADALTLSYTLVPTRRGRWALGPALVHTADPVGVMWADTSVGDAELIPVWPAVVDLSGTAGALMGHADRVVLGARTPSADDASLRDYRDGDDLRRVHWPSTARRGEIMVRSDERAGRRPATVIMDLPRDHAGLEWAISAAASIALSVMDSGHPVRLLGGGLLPDATTHVGERGGTSARADLLNATIDLHSPLSEAAAVEWVSRAATYASHDATSGEVIIGVFGPLDKEALDALALLGDGGRAWALIRENEAEGATARASETALALRRAGWRTSVVAADAAIADAWTALLEAGDLG